ncbi:flagellar basal body rod protein FlgG [Paenibacillus pini]|uniref:Flagellar hook protein FlgE n=1 Tax=Paenibacillus pini JCM 16418 TaxID=1236976 RepID=W7YYH7_9BACL|nr:flagellar basal body rod protein FlgG [Paenibacillus pini]GAF09691.1 flagellar hook protein FlgE [Paenibacillus pini JCM 16418]
MLRSMYSGVSGMRGFQTKLDVIGNNIANVNTIGFKSGRVMFKDVMSQTVAGLTAPNDTDQGGSNSKQIGLGVSIGSIDTLHLGGSAMTTNNPTDLRIDGDGFFVVKLTADQDTPFMTRAGDFHVDAQKHLVTSDGLFVCDSGGAPITLEENTVSFSISQDGVLLQKLDDGSVENGTQLGVTKVTNPEGLEKIGGNLYRITLNANDGGEVAITTANNLADGTGAIVAGQLEMSNVDLTNEFTEMIVAQRGFQANSRIITTSDEVLQEIVNLKR